MDAATKTIDTNKNAHLKGRRRFMADFRDVEDECKEGFAAYGLHIKSASFDLLSVDGDLTS